MSNFALSLGLNPTSLGSVSFGIAREIYSRGLNPCIFPIGPVDVGAQKPDDSFFAWLKTNIERANKDHNRKNPTIRNWHIQGSLDSFSERQILLTYHELSKTQPTEVNILKNQHKVLTCSEYSVDVFKKSGVESEYLPLFFDSVHFKKVDTNKMANRTVWFLGGKAEVRKNTYKIINLWVKKYGNNPAHVLNLAIDNHFYNQNEQLKQWHQNQLHQAVGGQRIWNLNFINWNGTNELYNKTLNDSDIVIGGSSGESWGLPEFTSLALGKHGVILDAHGYSSFATAKNSSLFGASGMAPAFDGIFFQNQGEYNVGKWFTWSEEDFYKACADAETRLAAGLVNSEGLKLQDEFSVEKTVDQLLSYI